MAPAEEKKLKLKSPNFIVSSTRLSVRNLPASWDEKKVKDLFVAAVSTAGHTAGCSMAQHGAAGAQRG